MFPGRAFRQRRIFGRTIHGDLPDTQLLITVASQAPPSLTSVAPDLPADLCAFVDRSLAFDKNHRYPHGKSMRADVRALLRGKEPPYVAAIASGRIRPGQPL